MAKPLRVLLVDDSEDDALLLLPALRRGGFDADSRRVDTPEEFERALNDNRWDIVITDHNRPRFSSAAALAAVRERDTDVPVIIVSGSIGEDIAVAAMRSGANDYIMKDNLARLVPAINRELREVENRLAHRQAQSFEAINRIGHAAGLRTIGEHVENPDTRAILARIGADYAQGYGIQRPRQVQPAET